MFKHLITDNGRFLVKVNEKYGCYTNSDGTFLRSVPNIQEEWDWATEKWQDKEEKELPEIMMKSLLKELEYVSEYKNSLQKA